VHVGGDAEQPRIGRAGGADRARLVEPTRREQGGGEVELRSEIVGRRLEDAPEMGKRGGGVAGLRRDEAGKAASSTLPGSAASAASAAARAPARSPLR